MSKSKNKGNKPDQNIKQSSEETKVKVDKEVEEKVSEETAKESVEETADEVAGEIADEVKTEEPAEEDNGDKTDEADETDKAELAKYDEELEALRIEVIANTVKHNKAVNVYNSKIAKFPFSFVARRKRKSPKGIFTYVMKQNKE